MTVHIVGENHRRSIQIEPQPELSRVSAVVRATWDSLVVENDSAAFTNGSEFLGELQQFERTRRNIARLEGTYDIVIGVSPFESRGDAMISFTIKDLIHLPDSTVGKWELQAGFVLPGEQVGAMLRQFEAFLA